MKPLATLFLFAVPSAVLGGGGGNSNDTPILLPRVSSSSSSSSSDDRRLEEVKNFPTGCIYDLNVHVDTHIVLLATPTEAEEKECPYLIFHDQGLGKGARKVVQKLDRVDAGAVAKESFRLGDDFDIEELLDAFNKAKSMSDEYSLITNNCATFALSMSFEHLGIEPNKKVVEYVAESLVKSGVSDKIASSEDVGSLYASPKEAENPEAMAHLLVMSYIHDFREAMF